MSIMLAISPRNTPGITTIMASAPAIATKRAMSRPIMNPPYPVTTMPTTVPLAAT
ncbi:MAG: hypothetical protein ACR2FY_24200 [Pirellulaceae bacterium]